MIYFHPASNGFGKFVFWLKPMGLVGDFFFWLSFFCGSADCDLRLRLDLPVGKKKIPDGFVSSTITVVMKRSGRFGSLLSLPKNVIKADRTQWNVLVLTDQHVLLKMFWKFYFGVGERVKTKTTTKHFLSEKGNCTLSFSMHCFLKVM